jgi:hypothetical protein
LHARAAPTTRTPRARRRRRFADAHRARRIGDRGPPSYPPQRVSEEPAGVEV